MKTWAAEVTLFYILLLYIFGTLLQKYSDLQVLPM